MSDTKKLTLTQMAARLNRCSKTFGKYVREYKIPHIKLGRDMLFNPDEVEKYLTALAQKQTEQIKLPAGKAKSKLVVRSNRYAEMIGLN